MQNRPNHPRKIFEYYKEQIITGNLKEKLLVSIENTGQADNIVLFADNTCSEEFLKMLDLGGTGSYTDQLRFGLDLNTIFDANFLKESTKAKIEKLWHPYQIGHDITEFPRAKRCLMYCLERRGPYRYPIEEGPFRRYVLYGEIQGFFLGRRYVFGIKKETWIGQLFNLISRR